jgi:apolipoprotein N-acyltransferase
MQKKKKSQSVRAAEVAKSTPSPIPLGPWYLRSFTLALLGALLFFFSFSPYGISGLAWVATVPFLILVRQRRLLGRRPYRAIWFAAVLAWLAMLEGIRRPYWALNFGCLWALRGSSSIVGAGRSLWPRRWCGLVLNSCGGISFRAFLWGY